MSNEPGQEAGHAYMEANWSELSTAQRIHYLAKHSPDEAIREFCSESTDRAECLAKIKSLAPWYEAGDKRSESRLAAMLARKYGMTWWREVFVEDDSQTMLGAIDDAWHGENVEPLLSGIAGDQSAIPFEDFRQHQRKLALMLNESDEKWGSWNDFAFDVEWDVGDIEKNATNLIANFNKSAESKGIKWRVKRCKNGQQLGFQAYRA